MKKIMKIIMNSYFLVAAGLLSLNHANAMRPTKNMPFSTKKGLKKLDLPVKEVFVRTNDGLIERVSSWQVRQMKVLLVLLEHQRKSNSKQRPLEALMINNQELQLLCSALNAASQGTFEDFWWKLVFADGLDETTILKTLGNGQLRMLVNAAEKVEALELSALCATYYLPALAQVGLNKVLLQDVKVMLRNVISSTAMPLGDSRTVEVCFSHQGGMIAEMRQHSVVLHYLANGSQEDFSLEDPNGDGFCSVIFSPNGQYLFCATYEKELFLWNRITDDIYEFSLNDDNYDHVYTEAAFTPDGKTLVVAHADECRFYSVESMIATFEDNPQGNAEFESVLFDRPEHPITSMVLGLNGNQIFFGWSDGLVSCYNVEEKVINSLGVSFPEESCVTLLRLTPDSKQLFVVRKNKLALLNTALFISNTPKERVAMVDINVTDKVTGMAVSPDGKTVVFAHNGVWGCEKNSLNLLFNMLTDIYGLCNSVAFSPDGKTLAVATDSNCILVPCVTDAQEEVINTLNYYDVAQIRLLYQLCLAAVQRNVVYLSNNDRAIFQTFDQLVQGLFLDVILARPLEKRDEKLTISSAGILLSSKLKAEEIKKQLQEMVALFNESNSNKDLERASVAQSAIQAFINRNVFYGEFIDKTLNRLGYAGKR